MRPDSHLRQLEENIKGMMVTTSETRRGHVRDRTVSKVAWLMRGPHVWVGIVEHTSEHALNRGSEGEGKDINY